MFAGEDEDAGHGLTDYELERIAHIRRNREIMRRLGLGVHDIVSAARQRCGHDVPSSDASGGAPGKKKTSAGSGKKRPRAEGPAGENLEDGIRRVLRRSRRLAEKPEEAAGLGDDETRTASGERATRTRTISARRRTRSTATTRRRRRRTAFATRGVRRASPSSGPRATSTRSCACGRWVRTRCFAA